MELFNCSVRRHTGNIFLILFLTTSSQTFQTRGVNHSPRQPSPKVNLDFTSDAPFCFHWEGSLSATEKRSHKGTLTKDL